MIHPPFTIAPVGKAVVGTRGMIDYAVWRGGELQNTQLHIHTVYTCAAVGRAGYLIASFII